MLEDAAGRDVCRDTDAERDELAACRGRTIRCHGRKELTKLLACNAGGSRRSLNVPDGTVASDGSHPHICTAKIDGKSVLIHISTYLARRIRPEVDSWRKNAPERAIAYTAEEAGKPIVFFRKKAFLSNSSGIT